MFLVFKNMLCTVIFTWFLILINGFEWSPHWRRRWRQRVPLLGILHMVLIVLSLITTCSKFLKIILYIVIFTWFLILANWFAWRSWRWRCNNSPYSVDRLGGPSLIPQNRQTAFAFGENIKLENLFQISNFLSSIDSTWEN